MKAACYLHSANLLGLGDPQHHLALWHLGGAVMFTSLPASLIFITERGHKMMAGNLPERGAGKQPQQLQPTLGSELGLATVLHTFLLSIF